VSNIMTASIPHQLTRAEARRRIVEGIAQARQQYGTFLSGLSEHWEGDTLHFTLSAVGQSVTGTAAVEDNAVRLEVVLPLMLAMLAGPIKHQIEQQGRILLGHKP
jgi:putative polyhydroxyalkanoate system protein